MWRVLGGVVIVLISGCSGQECTGGDCSSSSSSSGAASSTSQVVASSSAAPGSSSGPVASSSAVAMSSSRAPSSSAADPCTSPQLASMCRRNHGVIVEATCSCVPESADGGPGAGPGCGLAVLAEDLDCGNGRYSLETCTCDRGQGAPCTVSADCDEGFECYRQTDPFYCTAISDGGM